MDMIINRDFGPVEKRSFDSKIREIHEKLDDFKRKNLSTFLTSSFKTSSAVLLKIVSNYDSSLPVYFLNTGYHFPETLMYKKHLAELLDLNVIDLHSPIPLTNQRNEDGRLLYTYDTDLCCYYNKVLPLEQVLDRYNVWISGVRKTETTLRNRMSKIEAGPRGIIRYHPLLNWTDSDIRFFIKKHDLPRHPLDQGNSLASIGCQPCTRFQAKVGRSAQRWFGQTKEECGLHTTLRMKS